MKTASTRPTTLTAGAAVKRTARLALGSSRSARWASNGLTATNWSPLVDHDRRGRIQPTFKEQKVEAHGV